jgi:hypothetical protein
MALPLLLLRRTCGLALPRALALALARRAPPLARPLALSPPPPSDRGAAADAAADGDSRGGATALLVAASAPSSAVLVRDGDARPVVPRHLLRASFSRSSGAGGHNVNKVNTKAELRFVLEGAEGAWIAASVRARLAALYPGALNDAGEVFLSSQRHRTQAANLDDCVDKLQTMLRKACAVPRVRSVRTALSELAKSERRDDKRHRAGVKERRRGDAEGTNGFGGGRGGRGGGGGGGDDD